MKAHGRLRRKGTRRSQALAILCLAAAMLASAVPSATATPLAGLETRQVSQSGLPLLHSATLSPVADEGASSAAHPTRRDARFVRTSLAAAPGTPTASGAAAADANASDDSATSYSASQALLAADGFRCTSFMSSASRTRGQPAAA